MTSVATLVAWLAGRPIPDGPLCGCGRTAVLADDGAELCVPCLLRRGDLAARPDKFETSVLEAAAIEHADVVEPAAALVDAHMHIAWPAAAFGRELVKACETRGIPRNELWRATGIGRTALDNYRTGSSLPRTEAAAALAAVLEWPKLLAIVESARTRPCQRCGRPFRNEGGNQGAKRYCSISCRDVAQSERTASRRTRQAGQTGDGRRRYQALAVLRSGIRIAEERATDLQGAIDDMCRECEPLGACRTPSCPLRAFSPLPAAGHAVREARTGSAIRAASWTPERRARCREITTELHRAGRIPHGRNLAAHDPARREAWIAAIRAGKARARSKA